MTERKGTNAGPLVLVVDDEPEIHEVLGTFLQRHGFTTTHADTITEATNAAKQRQVEAVVLDLRLGHGQSGLQFLEWFRSEPAYVATPVLVLTGETMLPDDDEERICQHHAFLLFKPDPYQEVIGHLRRLTVPVQ